MGVAGELCMSRLCSSRGFFFTLSARARSLFSFMCIRLTLGMWRLLI